eukprot:7429817-Pyramimonas_sp.AAC.1
MQWLANVRAERCAAEGARVAQLPAGGISEHLIAVGEHVARHVPEIYGASSTNVGQHEATRRATGRKADLEAAV